MTYDWNWGNDVDFDKDIKIDYDADFETYVDTDLDVKTDVDICYNVDVDIDSNYAELLGDFEAVGKSTSVTVQTSVLTIENEMSSVIVNATSAVE